MHTARLCLATIVSLLLLAIFADLGAITIGGLFTADVYYLPLRNIDVGDSRDALESAIIRIHTDALTRKHSILIVIHSLVLASALLALWCSKRVRDHSGA